MAGMRARLWCALSLLLAPERGALGNDLADVPPPPRDGTPVAGRDERLAEQHFNQGVAAYEGERWSVAEVEFLASYALDAQRRASAWARRTA